MDLISEQQFGFRKVHSMTEQIHTVVAAIRKSFEHKHTIAVRYFSTFHKLLTGFGTTVYSLNVQDISHASSVNS